MIRQIKKALLSLTFLTSALALFALGAASAQAESPWWHLSSGARPAYLHAGAGKPGPPGVDEVQEIFTEPGEFEGFTEQTNFFLLLSEKRVEEFSTEPIAAKFGVTLLSAENIQIALEGPSAYGAGNVTVEEVSTDKDGKALENGDKRYLLKSTGSLKEQAVTPLESFAEIGTVQSKVLTPGKPQGPPTPDGEIYVTAENVGDANVLASAKSPIKLKDVLPPGLKAISVLATKPAKKAVLAQESLPCSSEAEVKEGKLSCELSEALLPYEPIEMRIGVDVEGGAESGELNQASITGAGTPPVSITRPITISSIAVPFGIESEEMDLEEEGGSPTTQAGAHPFQFTTTIALNQLADTEAENGEANPPALAKDLSFKLPPGLIGNPSAIPKCTTAEFFSVVGRENRCPPDSAIGVAVARVNEPHVVGTNSLTEPIFNLEPRVGEPARFGFFVIEANSPVFIDTSVRTGSDYGVTASVANITQTAAFLSSAVTFWGVPGDSRHNNQRSWGCLLGARGVSEHAPCGAGEESNPPPFMTLPTSCTEAMGASVHGDSWSAPGSFIDFTGQFEPGAPLSGCNRLQFAPEIKVAPDGQEASKPTGLTVDVHVPQEVNENAHGLASSNVKAITVTFPQGLTLNPSAADGLKACTEEQVGLLGGLGAQQELLFTPTLPEAFCPDAAKIGTVKIKSPLLPAGQNVEGALYLATPAPGGEGGKNPFNSLLALYIIAQDPISGTLVKLPGSASLDPNTGQITTTFDNNPQLAFEDAEIHLFGGERAPLATPALCRENNAAYPGLYTTEASFTPWSGTPPVKSSSSFQITSGPNGSPCPTTLPFSPTLTGGSTNINAGSFSPLTTTISRPDGNQQIQAVALHMPPGLSGILKGVELCPEAQANAGSCAPNSLIGHTTVSVGLGGDPFSVTGGQVFLTQSYKGAPFGLSIVNPAVAGPFDLGKVIVRATVQVDPHTAALTVSTDPEGQFAIPHILDGIPLQIQHVNVLIDRPGFTFNPTNCNPQAITGTIASDEKAQAPVSTSFQATNCAILKFAPSFTVSTAGKTSKASGASLKVKLTYPNAPAATYANVAKVKVSLPKQLPSRLTTLQKACTAAAFDANPASLPQGIDRRAGQGDHAAPARPAQRPRLLRLPRRRSLPGPDDRAAGLWRDCRPHRLNADQEGDHDLNLQGDPRRALQLL